MLISRSFSLLNFLLFGRDFDALVLDVKPQAVVDAHVLTRYPDQRKPCYEIASPPGIEHLKTRDREEPKSDVVAEAVFTREQIKKLPAKQTSGPPRLFQTVFPRLAEDFLMRYGPRHARDGNSQNKQPRYLQIERQQ